MNPAVDALPDTVRVGLFDFQIEKWSPHEASAAQRYGECDCFNQIIRIRADISILKAVDTFWHELLHALYWVYDVDDADKEERIVAALGTGIGALHRDNPWLSGWIETALALAKKATTHGRTSRRNTSGRQGRIRLHRGRGR